VRLPPKYYGQLCMGHFWAELFYTIALLINWAPCGDMAWWLLVSFEFCFNRWSGDTTYIAVL
jgi:hypothetical protein